MKSYRADLHIHTVLSPCGDLEMSPAALVAKALESGLDIIGITDHNSTKQCQAVFELGQKEGLTVIPGCEATSQEEVHCLCLFPDFEVLLQFQQFLDKHLAIIPNNPQLFGYQPVVDKDENIIEEINNYLGAALDASVEEIEQKVHELSGIFIPAHVDRPRNSIYSQLGFLPEDLTVDALQISKLADEETVRKKFRIKPEIPLVKFSDAHYLCDLGKTFTNFELEEPTFDCIRKTFKQKNNNSIWIS
jgi:PHP family Zn ribbon phosphoesterase